MFFPGLLDDVYLMLLEPCWQRVRLLLLLVLDHRDLVVSDQLGILLFTDGERVIAQAAFVGNLLRNELSVVASRDALVYHLLLVLRGEKVRENKLGHLNVVGEDV